MQEAIKSVRPAAKEWFATARDYPLYSNQGGLCDDVLTYLRLKESGALQIVPAAASGRDGSRKLKRSDDSRLA